MEIPNVAPLVALKVYLSETLALLRISSGSETGVTGLEGLLKYLVFLKPPYINGVTK